jgi:hypothetical protein
MAQTLASELNQPLNPSFLSQSSQRMQSDPNLRTRASKARKLEPLARAEETRLAEQTGLEEARLKREQIGREEELAREGMGRKEQIFGRLEDSYGQQPERTITAFNPERGIELATMTALLGAFAGSVSGTAALKAMEGVSTGYRTGQEDLYKREVEAYDAAVNQYKQKIKQAEEIAKNSLVLEAEQRGLGAIELKKLDPLLNDGLIIAKAKQGDVRGLLESIKQAKDLGDQISLLEIEAGFKPKQIKTATILNPEDGKTPIIVDINTYQGGGKRDAGYIADAPLKGSGGEDGDKIRMTTEPEKLIRGAADSLVALQRIEDRLADPEVAKQFDENRLFRTLLESPKEKYPIEKYITESIFQSLPPDSQELFVLIAMARNDYYKQISGQAVTGSEGARNFFATLQPTDGAKTLIQKSKAQKPTFVDRIEMGIDAYKMPPSYVTRLQNLISKAKEDQETSQIGEQGGKQQKQLSQENQEALNWANSNPDDPRAARIKQRLGVQ